MAPRTTTPAPVPTIADLRAEAAAAREKWKQLPVEEILRAIQAEFRGPDAQALLEGLRPLLYHLPDDEPAKAHIGNFLNVISGLPVILQQRIDALPR